MAPPGSWQLEDGLPRRDRVSGELTEETTFFRQAGNINPELLIFLLPRSDIGRFFTVGSIMQKV
jgi:hypothetical protein